MQSRCPLILLLWKVVFDWLIRNRILNFFRVKLSSNFSTGYCFSTHCNQIQSRHFDCTRNGESSRRKDYTTHRRSAMSGDRRSSFTNRWSCWKSHRNWGTIFLSQTRTHARSLFAAHTFRLHFVHAFGTSRSASFVMLKFWFWFGFLLVWFGLAFLLNIWNTHNSVGIRIFI